MWTRKLTFLLCALFSLHSTESYEWKWSVANKYPCSEPAGAGIDVASYYNDASVVTVGRVHYFENLLPAAIVNSPKTSGVSSFQGTVLLLNDFEILCGLDIGWQPVDIKESKILPKHVVPVGYTAGGRVLHSCRAIFTAPYAIDLPGLVDPVTRACNITTRSSSSSDFGTVKVAYKYEILVQTDYGQTDTTAPDWETTKPPNWETTPTPNWETSPTPNWETTPTPNWETTRTPNWETTRTPNWETTPTPNWETTRTPNWETTRTPNWETTRTPNWETTRTPNWETTRTPNWETTPTPNWETTRTPNWETTRTPNWETTRTPNWETTRTPNWETTRTPNWETTRTPNWETTPDRQRNTTTKQKIGVNNFWMNRLFRKFKN